ncbi:hypothetical protein KO527_20270 [Pseudoalteromonas sp. C2R02]|uniref:hypothetical protein n=1 Tax=Pseudoalteromonas sp. C2R02 TaxID=2841565 RepID=UPI001C09E8B2|nr:hypothetical protein [Pseudoalteromonas sp. C2R02]MBU2971689.1 hypothetical protein [Pseudoalteromonas sp. C2R02]
MTYLTLLSDSQAEQNATTSIFETLKSITPSLKEPLQDEAFNLLFEEEHDFILGYN